MKRVSIAFSLFWLAGIVACSSQPTVVSPEAKYQALAQSHNFSVFEMRKIVDEAFAKKDLALMEKALWKLCQRSVASANPNDDCARYLDIAIIQGDKAAQAKANIALYFLTSSDVYYQQAMSLLPADSNLYTDLFAHDLAPCLESTEQSEIMAMRCYLAGKYAMNLAALDKALVMFEKYQAQHNLADTYYLMARILLEQGDEKKAAEYAAKAALLLSQLGETQKAAVVRAWRQDNIYAQ